jgi:hypothetical protein
MLRLRRLRLFCFSLVLGLLNLAACRPRPAATCPRWATAHPPTNVFDIQEDVQHESADSAQQFTIYTAQRRAMLHDTEADCCYLEGDKYDSTGVQAYGYATVPRLNQAPGAPCHLLVRTAQDDFSALYLVLRGANGQYANLCVANIDGSAYDEGNFHVSWGTTIGRMLNDTLVEVKTGREHLAFRASTGETSYADSTTEVFRIDYRSATFRKLRSRSSHPRLPGAYFLE